MGAPWRGRVSASGSVTICPKSEKVVEHRCFTGVLETLGLRSSDSDIQSRQRRATLPCWLAVAITVLAGGAQPGAAMVVSGPPFSSRHVVTVSSSECAAGCPAPPTVAAASGLLRDVGFVVLEGAQSPLLGRTLVGEARRAAADDLRDMLARLQRQGFDTDSDSFAFAEVVHRSVRRYDLRLDRRRMPPSAPWHNVSAAAAAWAVPVLATCGVQQELEVAVEGVLTSLPGAPAQRFHQDGPLPGSFNCFVPLVDVVPEQHTGTEFWPGSHVHPAVPKLVQTGDLAVEDSSQLPVVSGDPNVHTVLPSLRAGDMLLYQYRVVHRGAANASPHPRPIFYCGWSDTAGGGDGYNFKDHRRLADMERRQQLFGL